MISVLLSTLGSRLSSVSNVVQSPQIDVEYVVVIQGDDGLKADGYEWFQRPDVKVIFDSNVGVTSSRNLAIENSNGEIALFADDDITFAADIFDILRSEFALNCEATFLTFNVEDEDGKLLKPALAKDWHNLKSILGVGTIQIAVRLTSVTKGYRFPLNLGAGTKYPSCDEPVYLSQFLKNGLRGKHIHQTICSHPLVSSGKSLDSVDKVISRLIAFRYIFGNILGVVVFVAFLVKNVKKLGG